MDWERKIVIRSDIDPLVMPVALAFQWLVQVGVKDILYSEIAHHFYVVLSVNTL